MICVGYPRVGTTSEELDRMYEAESAKLWEELNNSEEPEIDPYPALHKMNDALFLINQAVSKLNGGADSLKGTPYENRIESLVMDLENVYSYIEDEIAYIKKEEGV